MYYSIYQNYVYKIDIDRRLYKLRSRGNFWGEWSKIDESFDLLPYLRSEVPPSCLLEVTLLFPNLPV